jgi:type VI secretion system secreted protein VgrG
MMELIGAAHAVISQGSIGWKTTGASSFLVGAGHSTRTANASFQTTGASIETSAALHVKSAANISRSVTGALNTTVASAIKSTAGGKHSIKAGGALVFKVGGSMTLTGANVTFVCGGAKVSASPGGVLIEAPTITLSGNLNQSGSTAHS